MTPFHSHSVPRSRYAYMKLMTIGATGKREKNGKEEGYVT